MKAFVFAAGYGERLRPITDMMPKPLVPVCNVPCLVFALTLVKEAGIDDILCNLHYRPEDIEEFYKKHGNFGLEVAFSREEVILGTGGGLKKCECELAREPFLIINGDVVSDADIAALINAHRESRDAATILLHEMPDGSAGTVAVSGDRVIDFRGTLGSGLAHRYDYTGIAVLSPEIFPLLVPQHSSVVYTGFTGLAQQGKIGYVVHKGLWQDIGSAASYLSANLAVIDHAALRERVLRMTGLEPAAVSPGARVHEGAEIIRSVIGDGCTINPGAKVKESVIFSGITVGKGESVERKIVAGKGIAVPAD